MEGVLIPKYGWHLVAAYMSLDDVLALASTCRQLRACFDESFWKLRLLRDFPSDPTFSHFADVSARQLYIEESRSHRSSCPHVQRVLLIGRAARHVAAAWGAEMRQLYYGGMYGMISQANNASGKNTDYTLMVRFLGKCFELVLFINETDNHQYSDHLSMLDGCIVCCDSDCSQATIDTLLAIPRRVKIQPGLVVCGPLGTATFDRSYASRRERSAALREKKAILAQLEGTEATGPKSEAGEEQIPYVCSDNPVSVLRCLLGELAFLLDTNRIQGRVMSSIAAARRRQEQAVEEKRKNACVVSYLLISKASICPCSSFSLSSMLSTSNSALRSSSSAARSLTLSMARATARDDATRASVSLWCATACCCCILHLLRSTSRTHAHFQRHRNASCKLQALSVFPVS